MTAPILLPTAGRAQVRAVVGQLLEPYRRRLAGAGALFVARAATGLAVPAVLGHIVDVVVDGRSPAAVTGPAVLLAGLAVLEGLRGWAGPTVAAHVAEPALADLRERVVDRALHVPLGDLERAGTGDLVTRVDGDVTAVSRAVHEGLPEVVTAALTIGLTVVGLAALDWRLALAGLLAAPIQLHTVRWYLPRSGPLYAEERIAAGARAQQLVETVGGADAVRALGLADRHAELVAERCHRAVGLTLAATWLRTRFFARLNLAEVVGLGAILVTGFALARSGTVTVGAVSAAALYFQRLFDPVNTLLYSVDEVQSAHAALARLVGVADLPPGAPTTTGATGAAVRITGLGYAYEPGQPVVHDVALDIPAGTHLGVVGASGAGKSTLAKLVAGVLEPRAGSVTIGGIPSSLAGPSVVLVTQEVHVFAGPLADDLRLARPRASDAELEAALATVGALEWAQRLPEALATIVGDGGHPLNATQAQQLALARLVLADPPVAVLDEATAEAGSAGARVLEASAAAALAGRTAIVVAHRLTQAAAAGRVVVLDGGRIIEVGDHDQLVATGGRYAELWAAWTAARTDHRVPEAR
jgi:ATP-binding cassette subfamily C protein